MENVNKKEFLVEPIELEDGGFIVPMWGQPTLTVEDWKDAYQFTDTRLKQVEHILCSGSYDRVFPYYQWVESIVLPLLDVNSILFYEDGVLPKLFTDLPEYFKDAVKRAEAIASINYNFERYMFEEHKMFVFELKNLSKPQKEVYALEFLAKTEIF